MTRRFCFQAGCVAIASLFLLSCNRWQKPLPVKVFADLEFATYDSSGQSHEQSNGQSHGQSKSLLLDLYQPERPRTEPFPLKLKQFRSELPVPEQASEPWPVLVYIHGGGWEEKSRKHCPGKILSRYGYAVACVSYRYSTEAVFPAQIHDVKAAVRWLRTHADTYHLNPAKVGVLGDSAGGHLSALLGTSAGVAELEGGHLGHPHASSAVQAVVDWYGPTDFSQIPGSAADSEIAVEAQAEQASDEALKNSNALPWAHLLRVTNQLFVGGGGGGNLAVNALQVTLANPITHITADDPPFFVIHGDADTVVPLAQSELLVSALTAQGVPVTFLQVAGRGHNEKGENGARIAPEILTPTMTFFEQHLK